MKGWLREGLVLGLVVCSAGCGAPARHRPAPTKRARPGPTEVEVRGGRVYLPDVKGQRLWEAEADLIKGDFLSGGGKMFGVKCRVLENGKPAITARAREALYLPEQKGILLRGGVKAEWPERAAKVDAEEMLWALDRKTLEAWGNVRVLRGEERLQGNHLKSDLRLDTMELSNEEKK